MKSSLLSFLLGIVTSTCALGKLHPEEVVETFQQNPELFDVLAQISYNYMSQKNQSNQSEEEVLRQALQKKTLDQIPSIPITHKAPSDTEKAVVAFITPYCPHCRILVKNLIQLEKEGFFGNHTAVSLAYAPTNSAAQCATKAIMVAHKLGKNDGIEKALDIIEKRFNPVEEMDWPKLFVRAQTNITEDEFRNNMNTQAAEQFSNKCAQCISELNMNSFPVVVIYSKNAQEKTEKPNIAVILGNPSHIDLLKQALKAKLN